MIPKIIKIIASILLLGLGVYQITETFIGYGKLAKEMVKGYGKRGFFFENEEGLKNYLKTNVTSKDVILIKGSRGMKMERFINV